MKRTLATLVFGLLLLACTGAAQAQAPAGNFGQIEHSGQKNHDAIQTLLDTTQKRPFDVISYKLLMDWRNVFANKSHIFSGTNVITLGAASDTILLDASMMHIDSVWINNVKLATPPQPDANEHITIFLQKAARLVDSIFVIRIAYTRTSEADLGMYFYKKGVNPDSVLGYPQTHGDTVVEDMAYTMSEPLDAHRWMPCMDLPYDKANAEISVIVPLGITVISNGDLVSKIDSTDHTTFRWVSDRPISTYLMAATASKYSSWTQYYHRISNPNDSVPIIVYAWDQDVAADTVTPGLKYNGKFAYRNSSLMLKAFSERFGEYPFTKYGQVPVEPFAFGGMEHQSATTLNRIYFDNHNEGVIAHELMHQWFGDKTTCETWADIWLNESFATFGEAIWQEAQYGKPNYANSIGWFGVGYFKDAPNDIPVYNPPIQNVFNYATVYLKGGCVIHMLRSMLNNDTLFFHAFKDYSTAFAYSTANTAQFEDFMSRRLGVDLTEFMDQWIYGALHPVYEMQWGTKNGKSLRISVNQTQTVRDHFTMPLQFIAFHAGIADTIRFLNNQRSQIFYHDFVDNIDSVHFDSLPVVISQHSFTYNALLDVHTVVSQATGTELLVTQSPSSFDCQFTELSSPATLRLFNTLGQQVQSVSLGASSRAYSLRINDLPSGEYFVRLESATGVATRSIALIR
jgi:aminopeptidase N